MATSSSILAWRIPMDTGAFRPTVHGVARSRTQLSTAKAQQHTLARVYLLLKLLHPDVFLLSVPT